jgi:hypothetical protein
VWIVEFAGSIVMRHDPAVFGVVVDGCPDAGAVLLDCEFALRWLEVTQVAWCVVQVHDLNSVGLWRLMRARFAAR